MSHWQTGVDVGGTNTDLLSLNRQTGEYKVDKLSTTTSDQSLAVIQGIESGPSPVAELAAVVHGTTKVSAISWNWVVVPDPTTTV